MTFVITQPCIDTTDQSCVEVCPVDCIHFEEGVDRMLYIDPVECIDCGACQPACPVTAIFPEPDLPADQRRFTEINALWYRDRVVARQQVGSTPAAAAPVARAAEPETRSLHEGAYKYGETGGVEGKCALCGTYVIKGGTKFRAKSVLCPECAPRAQRLGNPFRSTAGRR
ncbi:MAG: ferredoxin family protein [Dehalococcoidia bacterium]|nr:ferredoxin family protein [Dehalococcoidia bacterium]